MPAPVLTPQGSPKSSDAYALRPLLGTLLYWVGIALLLGAVIDFGVLWAVQYQGNAQWEFAALTSTFDNYSLIVIALAALAAGMYFRDRSAVWGPRIVVILCFVFALLALLGAFLLVTDFFEVRTKIEQSARTAFKASMVKSFALSILYVIALTTAGFRGLKRR